MQTDLLYNSVISRITTDRFLVVYLTSFLLMQMIFPMLLFNAANDIS